MFALSSLGAEPQLLPEQERWVGRALIIVLSAAIGFRVFLALWSDFPISDGALFFEFVKALGEAFPALPHSVSFNGLHVPFAYPPLAFWLGGMMTRLGADPLAIVHHLPIAMNAVYVLLFGLLLYRSTRSALLTALALLFFCTILRSFEWLVMGGGLSRSLGAIFLMLTLLAVGVPRQLNEPATAEPPLRRILLAGLCVAGAILSHLEWGILAAAAFLLSRSLASSSPRRFVLDCLVAGLLALAIIAPWVLSVLAQHGLTPFMAAGGTGAWSLSRSLLGLVSLGLSGLANPFLLIGALVLLARRNLFWPGFILLCMFVTPRHGSTPATLAVAVLSAYGVVALQRLVARSAGQRAGMALVGTAAAVVLLLQGFTQYRGARAYFHPLPEGTRSAMAWVARNQPGRSFAVLTRAPWFYDDTAEWFPTLAGAPSITTVQGREWLPDRAFGRWTELSNNMKASESCEELLPAVGTFGPAEFIWTEFMPECFSAPDVVPVYRAGEISIFKVRR